MREKIIQKLSQNDCNDDHYSLEIESMQKEEIEREKGILYVTI